MAGDTSIGTTTGGYKLNVNGTFNATGAATFSSTVTAGGDILINNSGTTIANIRATSSQGGLDLWSGATADYDGGAGITLVSSDRGGAYTRGELYISAGRATNNTANGFIALSTANTERLRITSGGNVGIGTTSPGYLLDLKKDVNGLTTINVDNQWGTSGAGTAIYLNSLNVAGTASTNATLEKYKNGAFYITNNETNSAAFTGFVVGSSERMRITSGGNVLIGTTSDNGIKLQVAGRASISEGLDCNNSFYFRKLTYSTIASGGSETQNILFASANARKSIQIVVTAVSVSDAAIIQLKFDIIARWSGGSSLLNSGIGNIDTYYSRGIGDFTATSILTPSIGTSGNNLTLILTNSAVGNITNIVVNITENYS
jgi:hypothetical protein